MYASSSSLGLAVIDWLMLVGLDWRKCGFKLLALFFAMLNCYFLYASV